MKETNTQTGLKQSRRRRTLAGICLRILQLSLLSVLFLTVPVQALEGSMGYEGGISVVDRMVKDSYRYREVVFVTGKPIVLDGTVLIKKSVKAGMETATYTYKLANAEQAATLTRVLIYETTVSTKNNGQVTRSTRFSKIPTEVLKIGTTNYTLSSATFTRSDLTDPRPSIGYHAGEFNEKKVYRVGAGTDIPTVTVLASGKVYAYDQYWSNTQTQKVMLQVSYAKKGAVKWGGTAEVTVSGSSRQNIQYRENEPTQISFDGGYIRTTWDESVLDYTATFPEFDKTGNPTDHMLTVANKAELSTEPVNERLMVPDIRHLKGHWAEKAIHVLFGLEVIPGTGEDFNPEKYLTRSEFVAQAVHVFKAVPADPNVRTTATTAGATAKAAAALPFVDLKTGDAYLKEIVDASDRQIVVGRGMAYFRPDDYITRAEVMTIAIRALGLGNLATWPNAVSPFTDNDKIPAFARNAVSVCAGIGVLEADSDGKFRPNDYMTAGDAADLLYRLINYMGDDLVTDYREHTIQY